MHSCTEDSYVCCLAGSLLVIPLILQRINGEVTLCMRQLATIHPRSAWFNIAEVINTDRSHGGTRVHRFCCSEANRACSATRQFLRISRLLLCDRRRIVLSAILT